MTYQIIYSSQSTMPMQSDDLEALLRHARDKNGRQGISGALVYADSIFLQILEGPVGQVRALMARIAKDVRHEKVSVLQEGDIPAARFGAWNMAYVSATARQVARWAGTDVVADSTTVDTDVDDDDLHRTAQFAKDILALLDTETAGTPQRRREPDAGDGRGAERTDA